LILSGLEITMRAAGRFLERPLGRFQGTGGELEGARRRESSSVVTPRCLLEDERTEERSQVLYWAIRGVPNYREN
jgi:hypothetical protein